MIDRNKTYRTRDGREVRIYATDAGGSYPVHGAYQTNDGMWKTCSWTSNGVYANQLMRSGFDLIEHKPRIKRAYWINVYPEEFRGRDYAHPSKQLADNHCNLGRVACVAVEIDCEEGEGLP